MEPRKRRVRASLVALLAAATLFAVLFVSVMSLEGIRSSRPWVAHTREVQRMLSNIRASLVDAEGGQRGFLLTGDTKFLEPFTDAQGSVPVSIADLKRLTAGDALQERRAAEVDRLASEKLGEIEKTIDLHRAGQTAGALEVVHGDAALALMDDARRLIGDMRVYEDQRLEERTSTMRRNFDRAMWIQAGAGLGLIGLGLVLFAIHRDLARREVLELALREQAGFQDQFMGILGHDLQNPLTAILMTISQLERALPQAHSESLKRIRMSASRMSRMIDQLLDLTRARVGEGLRVEPRPATNLSQVVTGAVDELRTAHPQARVRVQADAEVRGAWDPDRLGQVVSNLVANAILYGDGAVDVRVRSADASAILEVHNGGVPIPADLLPRIFEPFRRARHDNEPASRGLGLGLYIAEQIVAAHGGNIDVRSAEVQGTTFTIALPVKVN